MLNVITLIGRLTGDPELRKTNSDKSFATFTIAVDNTLKDEDGERGTCFLDCKCFGTQAENLAKYTRKGHRVAISGSINQRNFTRQDGTKGRVYEVIIDSAEYLEPKPVEEANEEPVEQSEEVDVGEKLKAEPQEPKFDPMTGKPLKPSKK